VYYTQGTKHKHTATRGFPRHAENTIGRNLKQKQELLKSRQLSQHFTSGNTSYKKIGA